MIKRVVGGENLWGHCTDWLDLVYHLDRQDIGFLFSSEYKDGNLVDCGNG